MAGPVERIALQPGAIRLRHVKLSSLWPAGARVGPARAAIAGAPNYQAGSFRDLSFQEGTFNWLLNAEGDSQLLFKNAPGPDGVQNRDRFAIVQKGRVSPVLGAGMASYQGGQFRPGDEFIEIWREHDPQPLYVMAVNKAVLTAGTIELDGEDSIWLLKKAREFAAGFWCNAPRDVFEHYTKVWQPFAVDDFTAGTYTYSTGVQVSTNGLWNYTRCDTPRAGFLRVHSDGGTNNGILASAATTLPYAQTSGADAFDCVRVETTFLCPSGFPNNSVTLKCGPNNVISLLGALSGSPGQLVLKSSAMANQYNTGVMAKGPGPHQLAIEVRQRWVYYYYNGQVIAAIGTGSPSSEGPLVQVTGNAGDFIDVDSFVIRRTRAFGIQGSAKGDYDLPGSPPSGGLIGSYYVDADLINKFTSNDRPAAILNPLKTPYQRRLDASVAFSQTAGSVTGSTWQPPGPPNGEQFSVRWTGAIYLDFANYDYAFRLLSDDRARLWVGKTRFGEQLIDDWSVAGHGPLFAYSTWVKAGSGIGTTPDGSYLAPSGAAGPLANLPSGWYPIVVELSNINGPASITLEYMRSDGLALWSIAGVNDFGRTVRAGGTNVLHYFPLHEGGGTVAYDMAANPAPATAVSYRRANVAFNMPFRAGPFPGELAASLNGSSDDLNFAAAPPQASWSLEAWVQADTTAGIGEIMRKDAAFWLRRNATQWGANAGAGAECLGGTVTVGVWTHLVATYDGTNVRLYVNGSLVNTVAGTNVTNANNLYIGSYKNTAEFFGGAIAHAVVHQVTLSAAAVAARYAAGSSGAAVVPLSPVGIFEQQVRFESHYDMLDKIEKTFGLQYRAQAMSFESGEFPARIVPVKRVGRDTDYVLADAESTDPQVTIDTSDVCDALLADGAGLADPTGAAQVTGEVLNYPQLGQHLFQESEYIQASDVSIPALLAQRQLTELGLRGSPWEELQVNPLGRRQMRDSFPLSHVFSEFGWVPGDGIRTRLSKIGFEDATPRQIMGIQWSCNPNGLQNPQGTFKNRPRDAETVVREILKAALTPERNYQQQLVERTGSLGGSATSGAVDATTRVGLSPTDLGRLVSAHLSVEWKTDTSAWTVTFSTGPSLTVNVPGDYDVTDRVAQASVNTAAQFWAAFAGGTGSAAGRLVLVFRL